MLPALSGMLPDSFAAVCQQQLRRIAAVARVASRRQHAGGGEQNARAPFPLTRAKSFRAGLCRSWLLCAQPNSLRRAAHCPRRRGDFGVTLVVWSEDARKECFQRGTNIA